mmetsp:Transcript_21368/g.23740  ORF Transcript_21368/g.23740 Transcript_21368/m.23740 type:complete len:188 (+) Transcript_21368:929-1492(+)
MQFQRLWFQYDRDGKNILAAGQQSVVHHVNESDRIGHRRVDHDVDLGGSRHTQILVGVKNLSEMGDLVEIEGRDGDQYPFSDEGICICICIWISRNRMHNRIGRNWTRDHEEWFFSDVCRLEFCFYYVGNIGNCHVIEDHHRRQDASKQKGRNCDSKFARKRRLRLRLRPVRFAIDIHIAIAAMILC